MNGTHAELKENTTKLLPHQAAFVDIVLSSASRRVVILRADVGLGKTTAIASAAARFMHERVGPRVLVLCPAALRFQWAEMLKQENAPARIIDRYRFREMLDPSTGSELWPGGVATILSDDFAKQCDIRGSLASVHWDLVVVDEAHRFSGARAELLKGVGEVAGRVVLAALPGVTPASGFPLENATVVNWRRDELMDDKGNPLFLMPRPVLDLVRFVRSEVEHHLSNIVDELGQSLDSGNVLNGLASLTLVRSLHSSPAALEGTLRRFAAKLEENDELTAFLPIDDKGEASELIDPQAAENWRAVAGQALEALEATQVDSKLGTFGTLIADLTHVGTPPKRISALTDYRSTLYYLAAEIEGLDISYQLIHGRMGRDEQQESLKKFAIGAGILLATSAVMSESLNLRDVTDLVLYDLPRSRLALQQVFGRFIRLGRMGPLTIHALVPEDGLDATYFESLRLLQEIVLGQQG